MSTDSFERLPVTGGGTRDQWIRSPAHALMHRSPVQKWIRIPL